MQYAFSLLPQALNNIEQSMSPARLARYMGAARGDKNRAFRLYLWNMALCAEFYGPIQITEVALRNALHRELQANFATDWFADRTFTTALPTRSINDMNKIVTEQRILRGTSFAVDHIVGGLPFGFWLSLLDMRLSQRLWHGNIRQIFPHLPPTLHQQDVTKRLDRLRRFRNAVMHHYAIFDKNPMAEWSNIQALLDWLCPTSKRLAVQLAEPKVLYSQKPSN